MKRRYCCEANRTDYESYYLNQAGSGFSVFQGSRGQRGHGIGSVLSGLFRSAVPMLKRVLAAFGKQALSTGFQVASDVADGQNFGEVVRLRARQGIKRLADDGVQYLQSDQTGSGYRKRRKVVKRKKNLLRKKDVSLTYLIRYGFCSPLFC